MKNQNVKKTVFAVIIGIALFTAATALISALLDCAFLHRHVSGYSYDYMSAIGYLQIGTVCLTAAFIVTFAIGKLDHDKACYVFSAVTGILLAVYAIVTSTVLFCDLPGNDGWLYAEEYSLFSAYASSVFSAAVSAAVALLSAYLLERINRKEQVAEQTAKNAE